MRATLAALLLLPSLLQAQDGSSVTLEIPRIERPPRLEEFLGMRTPPDLDGQLARVSDFIQRQPKDNEPASQRTEVYVGCDDANLYTVEIVPGKHQLGPEIPWEIVGIVRDISWSSHRARRGIKRNSAHDDSFVRSRTAGPGDCARRRRDHHRSLPGRVLRAVAEG